MKIFLTGASGCIGHYLVEQLIQETQHELFLLVRDPRKLQFDYRSRSGIEILLGDLATIERYSDLLKTIEVAILLATSWGGVEEAFNINVVKNIEFIDALDPDVCQQVIYFSTASILDRNNRLLKAAGELGTDYIRTKYECYSRLLNHPLAAKITTVFPTLVLGGEKNKPYSHISAGLPDVTKWVGLIRWLKADGSFHFIHARDIAQVVSYLVDNPPSDALNRQFILGNKKLTVNEAIAEMCAYFNKKIYFQIPLSIWLANIIIVVFRIQVAAWDRFLLNYRHCSYENAVTPANFGLTDYCPTLTEALKLRGIS
jgi:nucleoside-diphosphate-sugar epimerase